MVSSNLSVRATSPRASRVVVPAVAAIFFAVALTCISEAPAKPPGSGKVDKLLKQGLSIWQAKPQEALKLFEQASRMDPQNAAIFFYIGRIYTDLASGAAADNAKNPLDLGKKSSLSVQLVMKARAAFDQAIRLNPKYIDAIVWRAQCYSYLTDHDMALKDFQQAERLDPNSAGLQLYLGMEYKSTGRTEQAIKHFNRGLQLDRNDKWGYFRRGESYVLLTQFDSAIQDFNRTLSLDPKFSDCYMSRGLAYQQAGRFDKAIQDFSAFINLQPGDPQGYQLRAVAYGLAGKRDLAKQDYAKLRTLLPK